MQFRRGFILLQWRKEYWIVFKPGDLEFHSYIRVSFRGPHVWHLHAKVTKPKKTYVRLMHLKPWRLITKLIKSKIYFTVFKEQHSLFLHGSAFFLQYLQNKIAATNLCISILATLSTQKGHCLQQGRFFLFQFDTAQFKYGMNVLT